MRQSFKRSEGVVLLRERQHQLLQHNVVFVELSRDGETIVVSQEVPAARAQCAAVDGSRQATDRQKVGAALLRSPAATPR
jgi:hypothetical protein